MRSLQSQGVDPDKIRRAVPTKKIGMLRDNEQQHRKRFDKENKSSIKGEEKERSGAEEEQHVSQ